MALSDKQKVQTAINIVGKAVLAMRAADDEIAEVITLFVAADPVLTDTALEGNVAVLNSAIASLRVELGSPVFDALIAAISESHRGKAL